MNEKELLCRMALPLLPGIGLVGARHRFRQGTTIRDIEKMALFITK